MTVYLECARAMLLGSWPFVAGGLGGIVISHRIRVRGQR